MWQLVLDGRAIEESDTLDAPPGNEAHRCHMTHSRWVFSRRKHLTFKYVPLYQCYFYVLEINFDCDTNPC